MSVEDTLSIEERVLVVLRSFVGPGASLDLTRLIGSELGISGGDSIELLDELEAKFQVDLDPLIQQTSFPLKLTLFERLLGKKEGRQVAEFSIGDLIQYIEKATIERQASA